VHDRLKRCIQRAYPNGWWRPGTEAWLLMWGQPFIDLPFERHLGKVVGLCRPPAEDVMVGVAEGDDP
jgi:hypothetical protein